jgi:hypothetical protein
MRLPFDPLLLPPQGLPYALASLGWVLGLGVLALATGASAYSAFLLAEVRICGGLWHVLLLWL